MKGKMGDRQRLLHIIEAIDEVTQYTNGVTLDDFLKNSMMRFACVKQIEIIGEASNYITQETKDLFNDIEWRKIVGMRHILVHEYFGISFNIIWQLILTDLPGLKQQINLALAEML